MVHFWGLINLSYISLCVTSLLGALLFLGFTFRARIKYPLRIVTAHVIMATVTTLLLCGAVVQALLAPRRAGSASGPWPTAMLVAGALLLLVTYALGLYFYLRFDARRSRLRLQSVALHLSLAGLSFVFITTGFAVDLWTISPSPTRQTAAVHSPVWFIVHRHRALRHAYELQTGRTSGVAP